MGEHSTPDRDTGGRRWLIAVLLVGVGSFLLAVGDRLESTGSESPAIGTRLMGWGLVLGSAFVVRHLGKKLFLYIPGAYILASVLSLSFILPAARIVHSATTPSECNAMGDYADRMVEEGNNLNARLEILKGGPSMTDEQIQVVIDATNNDIQNMLHYRVPEAAEDLHNQRIVVMEGWVNVFRSIQDGTFSNQMLFDLQVEDDEVERLVRQVNTECAGHI